MNKRTTIALMTVVAFMLLLIMPICVSAATTYYSSGSGTTYYYSNNSQGGSPYYYSGNLYPNSGSGNYYNSGGGTYYYSSGNFGYYGNGFYTPSRPAPTPQPVPTPRPQPEPTPEPKPTPGLGLTVDEQRMVNLINQERAKAGLSSLTVDLALVDLARKKSRDMIVNNYFSHTSPTYGDPFTMMTQAGINYRAAGENLAGAKTVDQAHSALMGSAGHRQNILSPSYNKIGVGIAIGGSYGAMYTQLFITTW